MIAQERLYLTADKSKVVKEGDPAAAFLYAAEGDEIPDEAAEKFGLKRGKRPEDKSRSPEGDKEPPKEGDKESPKEGDKEPPKAGLKINKRKKG